ncbi:unnamed protein product [Peniophora sp. CBMAI 1063]|nr:unnamed protein product [Peniophora sp. CBMAI 1063]
MSEAAGRSSQVAIPDRSTTADRSATGSGVRAQIAAPEARIHVNSTLQRDAWGALKAAAEILSVAASMTQNVPYLGVISSVLTEFLRIQAEVESYRSDWNEVMSIARQIKGVIDRVLEQCAPMGGDAVLPAFLKEPLDALEKCLAGTLETLYTCRIRVSGERTASVTKIIKARAREYLDRGELATRVKQCRVDMQVALDLFNTTLQIDQTLTMHSMAAILEEIKNNSTPLTTVPAGEAPFPPLPAAPPIFYGRVDEVTHIIHSIRSKHPARVAILGSGGIGKTTIALSVLNNPQLREIFHDRRLFMSCEAVSTADDVTQGLLTLFGLVADRKSGVAPQDLLVSHVAGLDDCILCLDNLETPWDADVRAVEDLLSRLAGLANLALIITTRGSERPSGVAWTRPHLPFIAPLSLRAALETWDAICDSHDDYSVQLVQAVDYVPLAVTLLAHLAQSESSEALWSRWEEERIELLKLRGPETRLTHVEVSIQISLQGPRLRDEPLAIQLLSIICALPQGLPESRVPALVATLKDQLPSIRRFITLLKQCSLLYLSEDKFLRVLSPVRLYMQAHHRITDEWLSRLGKIYCDLVDYRSNIYTEEMRYAQASISPELANITLVLRQCMSRGCLPSERVLLAINSFSRLCQDLSYYDSTLLSEAIRDTGRDKPVLLAKLLQAKAECLYFRDRKVQALPILMDARGLYQSVGNRVGEAECLQRLGDTYLYHYRLEEGLVALDTALDLWSHTDDRRGRARTLRSLGRLHATLERANDSEHALQSALKLFTDLGDELGTASAFETLGALYTGTGDFDQAKDTLKSALALYSKIGYRLGEANALQQLGRLYLHMDRWDEGESVLRTALELYREVNGGMGEVRSLNALGQLYYKRHQYEAAMSALESARDLASSISYLVGQRKAWMYLAKVHGECGRPEAAESCLERATQLFEEAHNRRGGMSQDSLSTPSL